MNVGLDTSVVLRLLTGAPENQAVLALTEVQAAMQKGDSVLVSDMVVSEAYFALQYHYGVPKEESLAVLARFLTESGVRPLGVAASVLTTPNLARSNPGFVDRMIHAEYSQSTGELLTFEKSAGRLPGVRVLSAS